HIAQPCPPPPPTHIVPPAHLLLTSTSFFTSTFIFHYTSTSFFNSISTSIFTSTSMFTSTSFFTYTYLFTYSPPPIATYTPISISTLTLIFDLDPRWSPYLLQPLLQAQPLTLPLLPPLAPHPPGPLVGHPTSSSPSFKLSL
ncbi:hypothetical protein V8C86DRAFT_2681753, partial [Haematococcus lacustris]